MPLCTLRDQLWDLFHPQWLCIPASRIYECIFPHSRCICWITWYGDKWENDCANWSSVLKYIPMVGRSGTEYNTVNQFGVHIWVELNGCMLLIQLCPIMSGIIRQSTLFYEKYESPKILKVFYYCKSSYSVIIIIVIWNYYEFNRVYFVVIVRYNLP